MPTFAANAVAAATGVAAPAAVSTAPMLRAQGQGDQCEYTQARNGESKLHFGRGPGVIILPAGRGEARIHSFGGRRGKSHGSPLLLDPMCKATAGYRILLGCSGIKRGA